MTDGGPYTSHGHPIPGITVYGENQPPTRARCGGPVLCAPCARDAHRIRHENPPTPAIPTAQIRALLNLLYPDHLTPAAYYQFDKVCEEYERC